MQHRALADGSRYTRAGWAVEQAKDAVGFQVIFRLADDSGIARSPGALRLASRIVMRHGEERGLVWYRLADTHGHANLIGSRAEAGTFACQVEGALRKQLRIAVPFQPCRIRPIENARHLHNSAPYIYRQEEHHGTAFDELHDGSNLPELLGMRMGSPWLVPRVRAAHPRLTRAMLLEWLGAADLDDAPVEARYIAEAAAAAWGVASLEGPSRASIRARQVAVHMSDRLAPGADVTETLGICARAAARYRREEVHASALRAVELQIKLRVVLARRRGAGDVIA